MKHETHETRTIATRVKRETRNVSNNVRQGVCNRKTSNSSWYECAKMPPRYKRAPTNGSNSTSPRHHPVKDGAEPVKDGGEPVKEPVSDGEEPSEVDGTRDRIMNDLINTGIVAALVGGFALGNLQDTDSDSIEETIDIVIYMLSFIAVHACTCASLSSAMLYRDINKTPDDSTAAAWEGRHSLMCKLPWMKFAMGCSCYILSVIGLSWRALEGVFIIRMIALLIGLMSMSTVMVMAASLMGQIKPMGEGPAAVQKMMKMMM